MLVSLKMSVWEMAYRRCEAMGSLEQVVCRLVGRSLETSMSQQGRLIEYLMEWQAFIPEILSHLSAHDKIPRRTEAVLKTLLKNSWVRAKKAYPFTIPNGSSLSLIVLLPYSSRVPCVDILFCVSPGFPWTSKKIIIIIIIDWVELFMLIQLYLSVLYTPPDQFTLYSQ